MNIESIKRAAYRGAPVRLKSGRRAYFIHKSKFGDDIYAVLNERWGRGEQDEPDSWYGALKRVQDDGIEGLYTPSKYSSIEELVGAGTVMLRGRECSISKSAFDPSMLVVEYPDGGVETICKDRALANVVSKDDSEFNLERALEGCRMRDMDTQSPVWLIGKSHGRDDIWWVQRYGEATKYSLDELKSKFVMDPEF